MIDWLASEDGGRALRAAAVIVAWLVLCALIFLSRRRRLRREALAAAGMLRQAGSATAPMLLSYASQTGFAQRVAWQTATALQAAGVPVRLQPLAGLEAATLAAAGQALFVVSTTGEGDPPDTALGFVGKVMSGPAGLSGLRYGLLALGDREYGHYCGFGHALDRWLRHQGATPLFDVVEVDNADEGALRHWQHHLGLLSGSTQLPDWSPPQYERWRLVERRLLNPGSLGGPAFHLALEALDGVPQWHAGDIAEIGPRNAPAELARVLQALGLDGCAAVPVEGSFETWVELLARSLLPRDDVALQALAGLSPQQLADALKALPHREYSIASLPADGRLELLVRQMRQPDDRLGLGSGWLSEHAAEGAEIALRIRENPGFQPPPHDRPLILIGNGTGLAGLRAHLKARVAAGRRRNWLLFGERSAAQDFFYRDEIEAWRAAGFLQRLALAFSRDQDQRVYVQQRLREAADELRAWVADGAAIYVCGSLEGMAPAVAAVLAEELGAETLERMAEEGRYRRDVY